MRLPFISNRSLGDIKFVKYIASVFQCKENAVHYDFELSISIAFCAFGSVMPKIGFVST